MTATNAAILLGLSMKPSFNELKKAYRKAAFKTHPDKGGKQSDFIKIKTAYDCLKELFVSQAKSKKIVQEYNTRPVWEGQFRTYFAYGLGIAANKYGFGFNVTT